MKTRALPYALGLIAMLSTPTAAQTSGDRHPVTLNSTLVGTWMSAPDEMKLTSDFDKSVWGANATSVRTLELTVRPSGEGTLRVTKKVVDGKAGAAGIDVDRGRRTDCWSAHSRRRPPRRA